MTMLDPSAAVAFAARELAARADPRAAVAMAQYMEGIRHQAPGIRRQAPAGEDKARPRTGDA